MAENPVGNLLVRLDFDGSRFERGITAAKRELASYGKAVDSSNKFAKEQNYSIKSTNDALHNMRVRYQGLSGALKQTQSIMGKLDAEGKRGTDQWARRNVEMQDYQRQMYYLNEEYKKMQEQSYLANSGFTKLGNGLERTSRMMQAVGGAFQEVGGAITQVGAVASAGGALFVKQAMDFERGMISVQKTTNASAEQMGVFTEGIRGLAREMPLAHGELAELASIAGQLGIAQDDLLGFTETMAKVGTATSLSASEASESFARFTNITGTGVTTIDNLASALVHLGNSYSTTETEIMGLATMLVGTLSSVGVSESQILGLSAAMSSLGITAERGGSSMSKFFSQMASAVSEGGDSLQSFADVAGVTGEAFASMFESDPMSALQAFIDGMVRLEGEGQSFVTTLDEMGITEVRLRDTLLRLAGGHEILNSALIDSASAYGEATALQQEYDLMMQSTAAQWEVAKNKMADVAIEIGGHLLPVIIDLLNQSDGLISMAQDVAKWFGDLDDGVKRNIVTWGALAVPVGAVLTGFGSLVSAGGSVVGLLGKISKGTAELSVSLLRSLGYFKNIDGSATTVLTTMLKLNPAILGVVGALGLIGGGIWVWDKLTEDVRNAKQAVEDFPDISDITHEQAESLRAMGEAVGNVGTEIATLNSGSDLSTLQGNLSTIGSEIDRLNQDKIAQLRSDFQSLPSDIQGALAESVEASINNIEGQTQRVEEIFNRLTEIQKQAYDETGAMRAEYIQEVKGLTDELMSFYATALAETPEQYREIHANLTRTLGELNEQELEQRRQYITQSLDTERQAYQEHMDTLFQLKKEGHISDTEYYEQTEALQTAHNARMNALQQELIRTTVEQTKRQWEDIAEMNGTAFDENSAEWQAYLDDLASDLGITRDELNSILDGIDFEGTFNGLAEASGVAFDQIGENAKAATRTAVSMWNEAVNTFEGEINSDNLEAFKQHVIDSGMTWDELNLVAKYANIDDNTREFLWNVIGATSEWDYMTLEEKTAKIETEGEEAFNDLMEKLGVDWESIQPTVHELILDGRSATDAIAIALRDTGKWDEMTLEEKMLLVDTLFADQNVVDSINLLEDWQKAELVEKYANVNIDTEEGRAAIEALLVQWGIIPDGETKDLWTDTNAPDTLGTLSSLAMYWLLSMIGLPSATLDAEDNVTPAVETATGEVISFGEESGEAQLGANVEPVTSAVAEGVGAVQELDSTTADVQTSTNAEQGVTRPVDTARMGVNNLDRSSASPVAKLVDYASATIQTVRNRLWSLDGRTANTYVYTHYRATGSMSRRKHGTPYHQGGMAILGDGGKHEPYLTPQGYFGVSPDHDTPVNLPMGSKVWSSINKFKQEAMGNDLLRPLVDQVPSLKANLPKYATGTDKSFLDELTKMRVPKENNVMNSQEQSSGDVYNFNIELQAIGTKLTSSQADGIIEPIIKSAERYGKKKGIKVNVGRS